MGRYIDRLTEANVEIQRVSSVSSRTETIGDDSESANALTRNIPLVCEMTFDSVAGHAMGRKVAS
jgi:hypothetical protein